MAQVSVTLRAHKRWFFWPAVVAIVVLGKMGLIRDRLSAAHVSGIETGQERAARWLAEHAIIVDAT